MQRRDFIKGACRICLLGAAGSAVVAGMEACSPSANKALLSPPVNNDQFLVPVSLFDKQSFQIVSPAKYPYEIAIEKKEDNTYSAILLKCTHYDNQLTPTGRGFTCSLHGSKFTKEGEVLNGPAARPLQHLRTQVINNNILINLQ